MKPTGEIHPAAALFPELPAEELEALAADIRANGLRQPIVLDAEGRLVDGRSRWAACKLAKVTPQFITLNGGDPLAFVVSMNVRRRNLTAGQLAIAAREAWDLYQFDTNLPGQGTREKMADLFGVGKNAIQQARALPDSLAAEVKTGARSLADAYAEHQRRVDEAKRTDALPDDLASRVRDDALELEEAEAIEAERQERIAAWVAKVRAALGVLARMAEAPVPEEFQQALSEQERAALAAVLGVIPKGVGE